MYYQFRNDEKDVVSLDAINLIRKGANYEHSVEEIITAAFWQLEIYIGDKLIELSYNFDCGCNVEDELTLSKAKFLDMMEDFDFVTKYLLSKNA